MTSKVEKVRAAAQAVFADDDVEIHEDAPVSWSERGAWVQAWVYVSDEQVQSDERKAQ